MSLKQTKKFKPVLKTYSTDKNNGLWKTVIDFTKIKRAASH